MNYDLPVFTDYKPVINIVIKAEEPEKKEPKLYTIKSGDNLTKIAEATGSSVSRLWSANPELTNPDLIEPEMVLKVPESDEVLPEREMPVTMVSANLSVETPRQSPPSGGFSSGNTYTPGQCTWHVKNLNPNVPNGLGNASEWKANWSGTVSSVPVVGAVAWRYGHVAQVVGVGDGTVTVSEMNYNWVPYSVRTITIPAGSYTYLY